MTHRYGVLLMGLFVAAFVLFPLIAQTNSGGAPARRTGAPTPEGGTEATCATSSCHDSFDLNSGPGSVVIEAPETYTPGEALDVEIRVEHDDRPLYGFQFTVKNEANEFVGAFEHIDPDRTQTTVIPEYVTHTGIGLDQGTWTVRWIPPAEDIGPVTIYAAGNAANQSFSPEGDYIYTASKTIMPKGISPVEPVPAPRAFTLEAAYPNPFTTHATVGFTLRQAAPVTLALYDLQGRRVRLDALGLRGAGLHEARLDAGDLPAGLYLYELRTPTHREARPLLLVR